MRIETLPVAILFTDAIQFECHHRIDGKRTYSINGVRVVPNPAKKGKPGAAAPLPQLVLVHEALEGLATLVKSAIDDMTPNEAPLTSQQEGSA